MSRGIEELRALDADMVSDRAHIVKTTLDDIIEKRFEKLNPVKAKGFVKILEREFDLDLSDWSREFDAYCAAKAPEQPMMDKLNQETIQKEKKPTSKVAIALFFVFALSGIIYLAVTNEESIEVDGNTTALVAAEANDTNTTDIYSISFDANGSEANATADQNLTEQNKTAAVALEANKTAAPSQAAVVKGGSFFVETPKKLWIGIRYLDTNTSRWFETVVEQKYEFNATREQLIALGHSQATLVAGATKIDPHRGGKARYHYKNGVLKEVSEEEYNKIAGIKPKPKDTNQTAPKH